MIKNDSPLSPASSIQEIFEAITPDEGMRVLPTQIPAPEGQAHLAILITGSHDECSVLMANLMSYVQDMHDVASQKEAESEILDAEGKPIEDEPTIILPGSNP